MKFPTYIRTKAEARALAAELFPAHRAAFDRISREHPGDDHPYFWVKERAHTDLRGLFDWLFDDKTRIYKRPRWDLFYDIAARLIALIAENESQSDHYWRMQSATKEYERRQLAQDLHGDGDGI